MSELTKQEKDFANKHFMDGYFQGVAEDCLQRDDEGNAAIVVSMMPNPKIKAHYYEKLADMARKTKDYR